MLKKILPTRSADTGVVIPCKLEEGINYSVLRDLVIRGFMLHMNVKGYIVPELYTRLI